MVNTQWIAAGDLNAAVVNQRWGYESDRTEEADTAFQCFLDRLSGERIASSQATWWANKEDKRATLDHVIVSTPGLRSNLVVCHSWHPSHDHAVLHVWLPSTFMPRRPRYSEYHPPAPRVKMAKWDEVVWQWGPLSKEVLRDARGGAPLLSDPQAYQQEFKIVA